MARDALPLSRYGGIFFCPIRGSIGVSRRASKYLTTMIVWMMITRRASSPMTSIRALPFVEQGNRNRVEKLFLSDDPSCMSIEEDDPLGFGG